MLRKLWNSRPGVWVRTCAELYGIGGLVGAVCGSTVLTGAFWALVETFTNLSVVPKTLLSIGVFGLALVASPSILKAIRGKRLSKSESQTIATLAFPQPASESYVIEQNKQLQAQNEQLKDENTQLRDERDKLKPDAERMRLRRKLKHYYSKGNDLYQKHDDSAKWKDEVEEWERLTFITIMMALRQEQGDFFVGEDSKLGPSSKVATITVSLDYLSERLNRLHQILNQVDHLPLRPDRKQDGG